jgi:UDP-glucuronate 4-epimerase
MKIVLVTGSAGFIGSSLALRLLNRGDVVIGLDNHNDYYDPSLKEARLSTLIHNKNYTHIRADLQDKETIEEVFKKYMPDHAVNLAAQAGVRYSIENPSAYIGSNIVGFNNILECCRHHNVKHLVYASSSSVYGANETIPFSVRDNVDHPISLYAATKKSNELTAHAYSNLFNLPTTGLRFFTVYGPWGRPDMALFKFTKAIIENKKIQVYNYGNHRRDFTYIDDIVEGVMKVLDSPATSNKNWSGLNPDPGSSKSPWRVYNIGNNNPVNLLDFIKVIEEFMGKEVEKELLPMQPGDVADTYADVQSLVDEFNFQPSTSIEEGVEKFITWYKDFYGI